MPFTLSHPAVLLPLCRRPFVPSALVAGAVAPDLPYVLPRARSAAWGWYGDFNLTYTHSPDTGLVAGTLLALALLALYHQVLKRPLLALLPPSAAGRLADPAAGFSWSGAGRLGWIGVSAVLGVVSHLAWDGLVHENGSAGWSPLPSSDRVTGALWWSSTAVGALALVVWAARRWHRTPPRPTVATSGPAARRILVAALVAAGLAGAVAQAARLDGDLLDAFWSQAALRSVVAGAMAGCATGVLLHALAWHARAALRERD